LWLPASGFMPFELELLPEQTLSCIQAQMNGSELLMREKSIEQKLLQATRHGGGLALKFISPGWAGVPDRLVLLPGKCLAFVEVKAPGKLLRPLQVKRKRQLEALGFSVYCIDHPDQIGGVLDEIRTS